MKNPYTFHFTHLTTIRSDSLFVERFMVNSNEMKDDDWIIYSYFDVSFTVNDVRTFPTENLLSRFIVHTGELKKRLSFYEWENHSELTDEEAKQCIIDSMLESKKMEEAFWQSEDMFYGLRVNEHDIIHKDYEIKVIHKHKIEIKMDGAEQFVLKLKGEGKHATIICFAYYHHALHDPIPIFNFLAKEVEEKFFKEVLKKTIIHRAMAPLKEE